ncbi:MAG: Ig-like domain-containing protein, partial [Rhizobiaceae bacterium]|nr:Ig-like domain-containing protein [Rhizobiaceae bacterium]
TLSVTAVNDAPVAVDDTGTTLEDSTLNVTAAAGLIETNDSDVDGDPLSITGFVIAGDATSYNPGDTATITGVGDLTINADGSYDFVPVLNYNGTVPVATYTLSDGALTDTATLTLAVAAVNDAPVAVVDVNSTDEDTAISVSAALGLIIPNDSDIDGDPLVVSAINGMEPVSTQITLPSGALLSVNADGSYDYDPNGQFEFLAVGATATDSFDYTVSDGNGGSDTATVIITITGVNDAPVIVDPDNPATPPSDPNNIIPGLVFQDGESISPITISQYVNDPDGDPLTFSAVGLPAGLSINAATGEITGTLASSASQGGPASNGTYQVILTATDQFNATVTTTLDFTISNVAPVLAGSLPDVSGVAGEFASYSSSTVFSSPDGDKLSYSATGLPPGLSINPATGEISGTIAPSAVSSAPGGNGIYSVTVRVDDGEGGIIATTFTYAITQDLNYIAPQPPANSIGGFPSKNILVPDLVASDSFLNTSPSSNNVGLYDFNRPVTDAVDRIDPLGAFTRLGDSRLPISDLLNWINETQDILSRTSSDSQYSYMGGDAVGSTGVGQIMARSLVINQMLMIELFGEGYDPDSWSIEVNGRSATPIWVQNIDGRTIVVLRPADIEEVIFTLNEPASEETGISEKIELQVDLITGQLEIRTLPQRVTLAPIFSEQVEAMHDAGLKQVQDLMKAG